MQRPDKAGWERQLIITLFPVSGLYLKKSQKFIFKCLVRTGISLYFEETRLKNQVKCGFALH